MVVHPKPSCRIFICWQVNTTGASQHNISECYGSEILQSSSSSFAISKSARAFLLLGTADSEIKKIVYKA